jgi:hypothetical protein
MSDENVPNNEKNNATNEEPKDVTQANRILTANSSNENKKGNGHTHSPQSKHKNAFKNAVACIRRNAALWTALATVVIAITGIAYTIYAGMQWCEMRKSNKTTQQLANLAIETESPDVWEYGACLIMVEERLAFSDKHPVCSDSNLHPAKSGSEYYISIEFENFGRRQAITRRKYIQMIILPLNTKLRDKPIYDPTKVIDDKAAIRPSGVPPSVERISTDKPVIFSEAEVADIKEQRSVLWTYGFIDTEIFHGRCQRILFCNSSSYQPCPSSYTDRPEPRNSEECKNNPN